MPRGPAPKGRKAGRQDFTSCEKKRGSTKSPTTGASLHAPRGVIKLPNHSLAREVAQVQNAHLETSRASSDSAINLIMALPTPSLHIPLCLEPSRSPHLLDTSPSPLGYPSSSVYPPHHHHVDTPLTTWKTLLTTWIPTLTTWIPRPLTTWIVPSSSAQEPHPQGSSPTFCCPDAMCHGGRIALITGGVCLISAYVHLLLQMRV